MPEWLFAEDSNFSRSLIAAACAFCALSVPAHAIELRVEVGPSAVVTNLLQRPMTADGTRFNAAAYTGREVTPWRVEAGWDDSWWSRGGRWRATYVPLRNAGEGVPGGDLAFGGARFVAGQPLALRYQFDTWRLAYTEQVGASWSGAWDWQVGGALAVRSARIRLQQGDTLRNFNNVGPVPLARFEVSRPVGDGQRVAISFEGFPAPGGGGLFDGAVRWGIRIAPDIETGLFFREQAGSAVDKSIFNRLQARSWGASLSGRF